jgi:hypothetical protein
MRLIQTDPEQLPETKEELSLHMHLIISNQ